MKELPYHRICFLKNSPMLGSEMLEGKIIDMADDPKFSGFFKNIGYFMWDIIVGNLPKNTVNFSFIRETEFGSKDEMTGEFTGCYGSMYRNESDWPLLSLDNPIYDRVNPFNTVNDEPLAIIQAYNVSKTLIKVDILREGLKSFQHEIWTLIFFSLFVFAVRFSMKEVLIQMRKKRFKFKFKPIIFTKNVGNNFANFLLYFILKNINDFEMRIQRYLNSLLVILCFIVVNYFCNLMATDMVVVPKPIILNSYQDIIASEQSIPYFFKEVTEYQFFKNSKLGSDERTLWEEALKRTVNGLETDLFLDFDQQDKVLGVFKKSLRKEAVMITNKLWVASAKQILCNLRGNNEDVNNETMIWASYDDSMTMFPKMSTFRQTIQRTLFMTRGERRSRRSVEAQLQSFIKQNMAGQSNMFPPTLNLDQMTDCTSETLIIETPKTLGVLVSNFDFLNRTCLGLLFISSVVLMIEILFKKYRC